MAPGAGLWRPLKRKAKAKNEVLFGFLFRSGSENVLRRGPFLLQTPELAQVSRSTTYTVLE